jgi:hypothetical protein
VSRGLTSDRCGAQVHEWSGVFKNVVMYAHFRKFRPGLRVAVNLFGGHYWQTQVSSLQACSSAVPKLPGHPDTQPSLQQSRLRELRQHMHA